MLASIRAELNDSDGERSVRNASQTAATLTSALLEAADAGERDPVRFKALTLKRLGHYLHSHRATTSLKSRAGMKRRYRVCDHSVA